MVETSPKMLTIDKALERLNNKLSLLAAAAGVAAAVAPKEILPFVYNHRIAVCIYLVVGVAPIQEFFHPKMTWQQVRTDQLGLVWAAKFVALWLLVGWASYQLVGHGYERSPDTAQVAPDYQKLACENGAIDPACKNYSSIVEIRGGEALKYIPPASLPKSQAPLAAGFVPIVRLGHKQTFSFYCGILGEPDKPPTIKGSTLTCP